MAMNIRCCISRLINPAIGSSIRCISGDVYKGKVSLRVKKSRYITLASSGLTTIFAPIIAAKKFHLSSVWMAVATGAPISLTYLYTGVIYYTTRNYVTEMRMEGDDKIVATKLSLFCRPYERTIDPKDIRVSVNVGVFESFEANGESYLIDENDITDPRLYECVMGLADNNNNNNI